MNRESSPRGDLQIREFVTGDLSAVGALVRRTIDICYRGVYPPEAVQFFKDWHCDTNVLADAAQGYTVVLEREGHTVGTGTLVADEIRRVFVDPAFHKKGYGRLIMHELEDHAILTGIGAVELDASLPSKRFYDLLGYTTLEKTFREVENRQRLDYYRMEKQLMP